MSQTIAADRQLAGADKPTEVGGAAIPSYLPERNPYFRGRKADLTRLSDSMRLSTTIGITQQVALVASGGVGKSSLALEFAWDCFVSNPPKYPGGVFWCDCRGRDVVSLAEELAKIAKTLGIEADEDTDRLKVARKVRDRLNLAQPFLLVLDNVVDSEQWKSKDWNELLPGRNCHKLLTTRAENLGDHRITMLRLDRLSMLDARALLHAYREDVSLQDEDDAVRAIVNWFGGLAIGLTIVGIYLRMNESLQWDAYWKSLREKKHDAVRDTEVFVSPADYSARIDSVIDELFNSQTRPEQQALLYASILPGDDVSDHWLIELLTSDLLAGRINGDPPPGYQSLPHAVIEKLKTRGILLRSIDTQLRKALFLHQVLRERFRELLQQDVTRSRDISNNIRAFAVKNYHRSRQWTQAMREATNFSEAKQLFVAMDEARFDPDVFTFTTLLSKADTYAEAKEIVEQMVSAKREPDVVTFNTLLSKADTYAEAKEIVEQMVSAKREPDVVTFNTLLSKADTYTEAKEIVEQMVSAKREPDVVTFNTLLSKADTYAEAKEIVEQMMTAKCELDVFTFTTLLSKADTYAEAKEVVALMVMSKCDPNVVTINTLLSKAETYAEAKEIVEQMMTAKCELDVVTFNTLLSKADTYTEAKEIVEQMVSAKYQPDMKTLSALFSKVHNLPPIGEILSWYYATPYHPSTPLNALIGSFKKLNRLNEAMQIALEHPHLSAGRKLMRDLPEETQAFFQLAKTREPGHLTADFALGMLAIETKRPDNAKNHLQEALRLATHQRQKETIRKLLE